MEKELTRRGVLQRYLLVISILSVVLLAVIAYVARQVYRVSRIRKKLYDTNVTMRQMNQSMLHANDELQKLNARLQESNRVKEEYIAQFFDMCSAYIDKWEDYRKALNKKAAANRHEEIARMLKSNIIVDEERKKLYETFDSIFLHLYPTFVEEFNALLASGRQITPKQGEMLSTELRIFALVRLGIGDSLKIASFLRYSSSTVYNYRTQIRNRALSRDDFEQSVMKIGSI
jgi:DNA-binding transcriptional regulator YiaG